MSAAARVLVVDDTPTNLVLLAALLREAGYEVRVANSAARALAMVEREVPDLILLDAEMPEMDGYEACQRIRAMPPASDLPIVFVSAHDDSTHRNQAFEAGASDCISKPVDKLQLISTVGRHLRTAAARRLSDVNQDLARNWRLAAETLMRSWARTSLGSSIGGYRIDALEACISAICGFRATAQDGIAAKVILVTAPMPVPTHYVRSKVLGPLHPSPLVPEAVGLTEDGLPFFVFDGAVDIDAVASQLAAFTGFSQTRTT